MNNLTKAAVLTGLLLIAVACSSSKPTVSAASTTTLAAPPAAGDSTTTTASSSDGDPAAYCAKLAAATDTRAALAAAIGTPNQAAAVADTQATNQDLVTSAPAAIHDDLVAVFHLSEMGVTALLSNSTADKMAALQAEQAAAKDPANVAAQADYKAWVQANCGDLSAKILGG